MWNLFEDLACNNEANVRTFEDVVARVNFEGLPQEHLDALEECLTFWRFRYRTPVRFADRFFGLNFRRNDRQELVEAVLQERELNQADKLLALMIIVYRLRNNPWHQVVRDVERSSTEPKHGQPVLGPYPQLSAVAPYPAPGTRRLA